MFGFFKPKLKPSATRTMELLPSISALTDEALLQLVRKTFEGQHKAVAALFLVAYENFPVYFHGFKRAMNEDKPHPQTLEGFASFCADTYSEFVADSIEDEVNRRRFFYFYLTALLKVAHARAKVRPELWESVAEIWVLLLEGARSLRETLDRTFLWNTGEVEFFANVKTEDDGEKYYLSMQVAPEIRYHEKIVDWQERDLSEEMRKELTRIMERYDAAKPFKPL